MASFVKRITELWHFALWTIVLVAVTKPSGTAEQGEIKQNDTRNTEIGLSVPTTATRRDLFAEYPYFNDFDVYHDDTSRNRNTRGIEEYYYPIHPPPPPPKKGYYVPVSEYYVKHHKPGYDDWSKKKPEVWEYKGTYHYKKKKKKKYFYPPPPPPPFLPAAMIAAGLPLIMMPLLGMLMTVPVLVPVNNGGTTVDDGTGFITNAGSNLLNNVNGLNSGFITNGRRRRSTGVGHPDIEKALKFREMQLIGDYLKEVSYDSEQQYRLLANYLQCQGMFSSDEHCLERLACEFRRKKPQQREKREELEKTVTSIFLGHVLHNEFVPKSFKRRLKIAAQFGRQSQDPCRTRYHCNAMDSATGNKTHLINTKTNIDWTKIKRKPLHRAKGRSQTYP